MIIRPVGRDDARTLFDWVNREENRQVSLQTTAPVPWESHLAWLEARLSDRLSGQWIAEEDGHPVGQVRLQERGHGLEVSVYVIPEQRGRALALALVRHAVDEASRLWPERAVIARIRTNNAASLRLFAAAGFRLSQQCEDHVLLAHVAGSHLPQR